MFQDFFGVDAHGAEFVAVEFFSVSSYSSMFEDDRTWGVVVDPEGNGEEDWGDHEAADNSGGNVEGSFEDAVPAVAEVVPDVQDHDFGIEERFDGDVGHGDCNEVWNDGHVFDKGLGTIDHVGEFILGKAGSGDEDGVDACFLYYFFQVFKSAENGHVFTKIFIGFSVFQETDDAIAHAGVFHELADDDVCRLPCAYDEDGYLEGSDAFNDPAGDDSGDRKKQECKECE